MGQSVAVRADISLEIDLSRVWYSTAQIRILNVAQCAMHLFLLSVNAFCSQEGLCGRRDVAILCM